MLKMLAPVFHVDADASSVVQWIPDVHARCSWLCVVYSYHEHDDYGNAMCMPCTYSLTGKWQAFSVMLVMS